VCVCVRERERERVGAIDRMGVYKVYVSVSVGERERERERERKGPHCIFINALIYILLAFEEAEGMLKD
jgi:hypothetical protein